jgi:hypothetical protein
MTTGKTIKVLPPSDSHSAIVAKSVALGVSAPKPSLAFCEMDAELNLLILANGSIPTARKHGVMALDIVEKLNSI